jgi:hypothetical protein
MKFGRHLALLVKEFRRVVAAAPRGQLTCPLSFWKVVVLPRVVARPTSCPFSL